ncbi:molybdopterin molybdenumtransferase MoeA [Halobacillus litoralis]|uniref:Molybdopterin molybdenumtransferase n=1 Tax=Halobacillus litoralis TaxID=45668 RepID=A0A845E2M3_9BACI|nr:gephyrin-like molybdotransferase Glp [Halobacillus litoralis]MYL48933.1 molybdopterin molybdenumtransferase MoeA [Halobacillus litoralis]
MNLHRKPLPVTEAVNRVLNYKKEGRYENVPLENSDGRTLAEDLLATHPVPPFNKSPYDGFALRSEDTKELSRDNPGDFHVKETIGAGQLASRPVEKGEAVRIMTGAEIPEGADCVAMFEICQTYEDQGASYMTLKRSMEKDQNIIGQGSETEEGTVLVEAGTRINPGVKALLATFGYPEVQVYRKPKIGVFATGTELLDVDEPLQPGKIRNSNAPMILSQIERAGGEGHFLGKLVDDFDACYDAVSRSLDDYDLLITTGGVSVGDYDLMPDIYEKLRAQVLFNKVAMRPGSVTTVAELEGQLLYGLSGNPSACYVGFELFTYPIIQTLLGNPKPFHTRLKATLGEDFPKPNPFTRFVRGKIHFEEGKVMVSPAGMDKSNVVTSLAHTNAFLVLPRGTRGFKKGDAVEAIFLENQDGQKYFEEG